LASLCLRGRSLPLGANEEKAPFLRRYLLCVARGGSVSPSPQKNGAPWVVGPNG
jgi:hypothetical protein